MLKIATLALGAALLAQLGSCSTTSSTLPAVVDVQNITNAFCEFLPTATTIEAIEKANSTITNATTIAQLVCAALATPATTSAHRVGTPSSVDAQVATVTVNGQKVAVVGHYTK